MRQPAITARETLRARLQAPAQEAPLDQTGELPPYMESFLAHLRVLVGVPFEYLIPDERLLPPESIRFFYVDRSFTDRLVDGALAVGQIGSREGAHYHAQADALGTLLDQSERMVRPLQRKAEFDDARSAIAKDPRPAEIVTGFIMRSSAVKQWPHMDVRAYARVLPEPYDAVDHIADQLHALRIERLTPSVLIALFEREPQMVILEEPHHGVQFGVRHDGSLIDIPLRDGGGNQIRVADRSVPVAVPMRPGHNEVIRVAALRDALQAQRAAHPTAVDQTGSASFAISVLDPPWRQHFQGTEDVHDRPDLVFVNVADRVRNETLRTQIRLILGGA